MVPTRTIIYPRPDVFGMIDVQDIPKYVCNRIQDIKRHHICLTDAGYDSILDEIECQEKKYSKRTVSDNSDEE